MGRVGTILAGVCGLGFGLATEHTEHTEKILLIWGLRRHPAKCATPRNDISLFCFVIANEMKQSHELYKIAAPFGLACPLGRRAMTIKK